MSSLKKNIVVNYLGQAWGTLMGIAFLPIFIQYLGIEAYGLIGLFVVMQAWLTLLDMGMTPALNREMARFTAGAHSAQSIRDLLRSLELLCCGLAVCIFVGVWFASDWLANDWLKADKLPTEVVAKAISIMAFVVALRFIESIYRGSLFGLEKQVWYNGATAMLISIRQLGALAILAWVSPTIQAFFLWQAAISVLSVFVYVVGVNHALPKSPSPARFSKNALAKIWKFSAGMMGITLLATLLTQIDKVLLSKLLSLEAFGYYVLAGAVTTMLNMVNGPIAQAVYPRMVALSTKDNQNQLVMVYHKSAQLITVLTAPAALLISFFAGGIVYMWSGDENLAVSTAPILSVLVLGTFLNGLMWIPAQLQLAHAWTSLGIKTNIVAVIVLVPALFWVVPSYGAMGAALIWLILNSGYVLISIQFMHRRLIPQEKWRWYFADVLLPLIGSCSVVLLAQQFQPISYQNRWHWFIFILLTGIGALFASAMFAQQIRQRLVVMVGEIIYRKKGAKWQG